LPVESGHLHIGAGRAEQIRRAIVCLLGDQPDPLGNAGRPITKCMWHAAPTHNPREDFRVPFRIV